MTRNRSKQPNDEPEEVEEHLEERIDEIERLREFVDETSFSGDQRKLTGEVSIAADQHPGDTSDFLYQRELMETARKVLDEEEKQARAALEARAEGRYGICESCGVQIPEERLRARPQATLCIDCQREREARHRQREGAGGAGEAAWSTGVRQESRSRLAFSCALWPTGRAAAAQPSGRVCATDEDARGAGQIRKGTAMLTAQQNEALTQVGPGTRMGKLMRRYWHPLAPSSDLAEHPLQRRTLLGESLVLFRDKRGTPGLLAERCPHRGASLAYGTLERSGLRCSQHGWLFDSEGRCLEQPLEAEPAQREDCGTTAYPVRELGGLVFAYLGPPPAPVLPRYNVLVWDDAERETNGTMVPCNWLQVMENLLDPMHVECLHGRYFADVLERKGGEQFHEFVARYYPRPMKKIGFDLFEHGIIERHVVASEEDRSWRIGTPSFFPTTSLLGAPGRGGSVIFIVPIDDEHTWFLLHMANHTGHPVLQKSIPFLDVPGQDLAGNFVVDTANGQDHMAVVTQGRTARRDHEHLATSDIGIVLYRELLAEQIELVESGADPMNVRRDSAHDAVIDIPGDERSLQPVDTSGWSRQRRRWAARHVRAEPRGQPTAVVAVDPAESNSAAPPVLREHREVVLAG